MSAIQTKTTVMGSVFVAIAGGHASMQATVPASDNVTLPKVVVRASAASTPDAFSYEKETELAVQTTAVFPLPLADKWTGGLERKFSNLVVREARGMLTKVQSKELEDMQNLRRSLKNPMTVDDLIYEMRRGKIIKETIEALCKYVEFFSSKDNAKTQP
jgi:hypothetical protein